MVLVGGASNPPPPVTCCSAARQNNVRRVVAMTICLCHGGMCGPIIHYSPFPPSPPLTRLPCHIDSEARARGVVPCRRWCRMGFCWLALRCSPIEEHAPCCGGHQACRPTLPPLKGRDRVGVGACSESPLWERGRRITLTSRKCNPLIQLAQWLKAVEHPPPP